MTSNSESVHFFQSFTNLRHIKFASVKYSENIYVWLDRIPIRYTSYVRFHVRQHLVSTLSWQIGRLKTKFYFKFAALAVHFNWKILLNWEGVCGGHLRGKPYKEEIPKKCFQKRGFPLLQHQNLGHLCEMNSWKLQLITSNAQVELWCTPDVILEAFPLKG